jgi:hydroxymethylbilane synthase
LGTRGSALALAQARHVKDLVMGAFPDVAVEIVVIKTTGDRLAEGPGPAPDGKGVFIKEIEEALADGRVDAAAHSLKDMPVDLPPGFALGAVMEREDPRDCLVSRFGEQLRELPRGAVVGTGSPRRRAQVKAANPRVRVTDLRGNVDTRLRKVGEGDVDAAVLAYAGLRRLGRAEDASEILPLEVMLPAPGQGFVTVEIRAADDSTRRVIAALDNAPARRAAAAERAFLAALGGGCRVPIAAYAREEGGLLKVDGLVISCDGKRKVSGTLSGPPDDPSLGARLGERLLKDGAGELLSPGEKLV